MEITKENYVSELCSTVKKIEELRDFAKQHPLLYIYLGRCNGKTRFAFRVLKHYSAIILAYEKAEKKASKSRRRPALCEKASFLSCLRRKIKGFFSFIFSKRAQRKQV